MSDTFPSSTHQTIYGLTGGLAGASAVPIETLWQRYLPRKPPVFKHSLRLTAPTLIYRGGVRFWVFDLAKSQIQNLSIPIWAIGGLSGGAGGFAEICLQSLVQRRLPTMASLVSQTSRLFICFGSYTYLSTTLSPNQSPPKPFWYCWLMGAAAGAFGNGIIAKAEGLTWSALWRNAIPKGALTIGTVIAVQVTSCASVLDDMPRSFTKEKA